MATTLVFLDELEELQPFAKLLDRDLLVAAASSIGHGRPSLQAWSCIAVQGCTTGTTARTTWRRWIVFCYPETDDVRVRVRLRDGRTVVVHETESWRHGCVGSVEAVEPAPVGATP